MAANDNAPSLLLDEWPRSHREVWRVHLQRYQGRPIVSVRAWYRDGAGLFHPCKQGLAMDRKHLARLLDALVEAYRLASADDPAGEAPDARS